MSVKDELTKDFMSQNSVFAEFINYSIHNGEELIEPENLQELDSVHITSLLNKMEETGDITPKTVKRTRDIIKRSVIKSKSSCRFTCCVKNTMCRKNGRTCFLRC